MPTASFVHANGSVIFSRGPRRPDNTFRPQQPVRRSAAGVRSAYYSIINDDLITLPLRLSAAEKELLISFWDTVVDGMAETFVYTDTNGIAYTVVFDTPALPDLTEVAYNEYEVTVTLRVL